MNSTKINLFEFPSNLGLKKKEAEVEPGVRLLPCWLRKHSFHQLIKPEQIFTLTPPAYSMDMDEESGVRNADKIIRYAQEQGQLLSDYLTRDSFQLIIGGDCSILIGTALALKQAGEYGLFFLDGHTDFILPQLSQTGGAAGMDLAIVTGNGHNKLTNILHLKPYMMEKNVWCVGNREYDSQYVQPMLDSGIHYVDLHRLRKMGMKNCTNEFLNMIEQNKLDGFFIHLDVDVLSDDLMPAVDSRAADGLTYLEFRTLLSHLLLSPKAIGIEITILDPRLDKEGIYTREFIENFIISIQAAKAGIH